MPARASYNHGAMTRVRLNFRTPGRLLLVVAVLANLACVCRSSAATARGAEDATALGSGGSHSCCEHRAAAAGEHPTPARHAPPGHGDNSDCPHCGTGTAALERLDASHVTKLEPGGRSLFTGDSLPLVSSHALSLHFRYALAPPLNRPAPTLLGLHCALN